jgi:hypothetical protein
MEAIMAAKEISVEKYVVRLSREERQQLETLIRKGKAPARRLLKARILLKADVSDAGEGWSDNEIIRALDTSVSMVYRVRKQLVEEGFAAVVVPEGVSGSSSATATATGCRRRVPGPWSRAFPSCARAEIR